MDRKVSILIRATSLPALVTLLVILTLVPEAHATPPIGTGQTIEFATGGSDVGATVAGVNAVYAVVPVDLDGDGDQDLVTGDSGGFVIAWQNDGSPFSGLWAQNVVGTSADTVFSVALGDLDGDGDLDIASGSGALENYEVIVWENDGTPFSDAWTPNDVGASADTVVSVALGDLDGDGDLDIVSGSGDLEDYEVIVWENSGTPFSGAWTPNDVGAAAAIVTSVTLGDLDDDGDLDIASGSYYMALGYEVLVWENDGTPFSGTWTSNDVASPAASTMSVALGDLDNDGDLDIASGSWSILGYEVNVFQNDGTPFSGYWTPNGVGESADNVWSVAVGDLDNDGDLDIVSGSWSGEDQEVIAWQNDGSAFSGAWAQSDIGASSDYVYAVAVGDLDGDGDLDVISGSESGEDYEVIAWRNDAVHRNAPFGLVNVISSSAASAHFVYATDVDRDGDVDILSASSFDDTITWYENDSSQAFTAHIIATDARWAISVYATDMDDDGDVDILSASSNDNKIAWYENDGSQAFTAHTITTAAIGAWSVYATDVDRDGDVDVLSASSVDGMVAWYENDGSQNFTTYIIDMVSGGAWSVYATDMDGDGDVDVLSAFPERDRIMWYENNGSQGFGPRAVTTFADYAASVYATDVDGDGDVDVLSASCNDNKIAWYENDGSQAFTAHTITTATIEARSVYATDMDGDGDVDVLSASREDDTVAWYENDGGQAFTAHTITTAADYVVSVYATDIDGDGDADVLSASFDDDTIAWYENQGGSAGLDVTSTAPTGITDGVENDVFQVVFTHNGIAADRTLELSQLNLDVLHSDCTTPYTSTAASAIIDDIYVRPDDGDGVFSTIVDSAVATVDTLNLSGGVQTINFTDNDASAWVTQTTTISRTYWISIKTTGDASSQSPNGFCIELDSDADILVEGKTPDFSVSQQDTEPTNTGGISNDAPTAVTLARFEAALREGAILVEWETALEINNVGFNLYRSTSSGGPYAKLNDTLIPSKAPGAVWGAVYTRLDEDVEPGVTYYYKLQDIEVGGARTLHGPVSASVQSPTALSLVSFGTQGGGALVVLLVTALTVGSAFAFHRRRK